jgi:glycosyltransferase involved in cell wall biosynthesis
MARQNIRRVGPDSQAARSTLAVIVAARNEAELIAPTLDALREALPRAALWVADDASSDGTGAIALANGARLVGRRHPHGKGANVSAAAEAALGEDPAPDVVLLCDGDLGSSAARLVRLVEAIEAAECDLAVASFSRRSGGGLGITLGFSRWAIGRLCGARPRAPLSGQRAMRAGLLSELLPFAPGYGMEVGMSVDALRAGKRLREYELDLEHRTSGRSPAGFAHRAVQLRDIFNVYRSRRRG